MTAPLNLHATTVAIDGRAVLLRGQSGSGKSDLALRLIDRGATLVADDRTLLTRSGDALLASAPSSIAGMIEVRGVGIMSVEVAPPTPLALVADLDRAVDRLPEPTSALMLDVAVPSIAIAATEPSAPIKVELALRTISR